MAIPREGDTGMSDEVRRAATQPPTDAGVVSEWWAIHAKNPDRVLPKGIFADHDLDGLPIVTSTDHRMLWHMRDYMLGATLTPYLQDLYRFLCDYLNATCQHHWREYWPTAEDYLPPHRQCLWCNGIEDLA
jgi:hypothetical protein